MQRFDSRTFNMPLMIVTVAEAQTRLPELIAKMTAGELVVIADGGKWVAELAAPPPMPSTPEEIAAQQERAKEAVRQMVRWQIEAGRLPPTDSQLWELFSTDERNNLTRAAVSVGVMPFTP